MGYFKDLREHSRRWTKRDCWSRLMSRSIKTPSSCRWCGGSFAGFRKRNGGRSCLPTSLMSKEKSTTFRSWSEPWPLHAKFTASDCSVNPRRSSSVGTRRRAIRSHRRSSRRPGARRSSHGGVIAWKRAAWVNFRFPISTPGYDCAPFHYGVALVYQRS